MSIFSKLFGGGLSSIMDSVGGLIDKFKLSPQEKQDFKLELQGRLMQMEQQMEESYRQELAARAEIIKAELAQGDTFTKRARPMIIYSGLFFIFIVYVLVPVIYLISGADLPSHNHIQGQTTNLINLPSEFWWAWGTVVGVYGAGRTAEKYGAANRLTNLITASNAYKVDKEVKG